jgi:hypothetical protein
MGTIDLSEFYEDNKKRCIVGRAITNLKPEDAEKIQAAFVEEEITNTSINKFLGARGVKISTDSVRNHRYSRCGCNG